MVKLGLKYVSANLIIAAFPLFIKKTILQNNDYKSIIILSKEGLDADFLEVLRQGIDANIIYLAVYSQNP